MAGGRSSRMPGVIPKQFRRVNGDKMLITYSLETFIRSREVEEITVVIEDQAWEELILHDLTKRGISTEKLQKPFWKARIYDRQHAVMEGIRATYEWRKFRDEDDIPEEDVLIVHDASTPTVREEDITKCLEAFNGYDGVVLEVDGHEQTPVVFYARQYYMAVKIFSDKADCPELVYLSEPARKYGLDTALVEGVGDNINIVTQKEWDEFSEMIRLDRRLYNA